MWLRIFDNEKQPYLALSPISHVTNSAQKRITYTNDRTRLRAIHSGTDYPLLF